MQKIRLGLVLALTGLLAQGCTTAQLREDANKRRIPGAVVATTQELGGAPWVLVGGDDAQDPAEMPAPMASHRVPISAADLAFLGRKLPAAIWAKASAKGYRVPKTLKEDAGLVVFLARNQRLKSAWDSKVAARHRHGQVLALRRLLDQYEGFRKRPDQPRPTQTIPSEETLEGAVVDADVAIEGVRFERTALDLVVAYTRVFHEARFQSQTAATLHEHTGLARRLVGVARARFMSGTTSTGDVLRAEMRLEQIRQRARTARERRDAARRRLGALVDAETRVAPGAAAKIPVLPALKALRTRASTEAPDVRLAALRMKRGEAMLELAERKLLPDWSVGLSERRGEPGREPFRAGYAAGAPYLEELRDRVAGAERALSQSRTLVPAGAEKASARLSDALRRVRLNRAQLLPRARKNLKTIESEYRVGRRTFLELDDAQRIRLDVELGLYKAVRDAHIAAADVRRIVGGALTSAPQKTR